MRLKELRNRAGLSQEELAIKFDTTSATISRWETGKHMPKRKNILKRISQFFHCTIDDLLSDDENPPSTPSPEGAKKTKPRPIMKDRHKHSKVA